MNKDYLLQLLRNEQEATVSRRRYLHAHPELSFKEKETAAYITRFYENLGLPVQHCRNNYGLTVLIDSGKPGRTLALRADFDALPIQEDTGLPFASVNQGVMHACGHDAHTAYLMTVAACLARVKDSFNGKVLIIHQPAEEMAPGGAKGMIAEGVLDGVDTVMGCHFMSTMPCGKVFYHAGAVQHARSKFTIQVIGKGGHASLPEEANDAILIASELVVNLQSIISRRVASKESAVLTVGSFDGKGQFNIIKDQVTLEGDVRSMSDYTCQLIEEQVKRICHGLEEAYGCTIKVDYVTDYPVLVNDKNVTGEVVHILQAEQELIPEITGIEDCGVLNPSEDFAYFAAERPACFFYIGAMPTGEVYPHHHPKFRINEKSLQVAALAVGSVAWEYLQQK